MFTQFWKCVFLNGTTRSVPGLNYVCMNEWLYEWCIMSSLWMALLYVCIVIYFNFSFLQSVALLLHASGIFLYKSFVLILHCKYL